MHKYKYLESIHWQDYKSAKNQLIYGVCKRKERKRQEKTRKKEQNSMHEANFQVSMSDEF